MNGIVFYRIAMSFFCRALCVYNPFLMEVLDIKSLAESSPNTHSSNSAFEDVVCS